MVNNPSPPPGSVPGFSPADLEGLADQMGQGGTNSTNPLAGLGGASSFPGSAGSAGSQNTKTPQPIGSLPQEAKYIAEGMGQEALAFLPDFMQKILGMKSTDTPEEKQKKQQIFQNYQKLNAEDQAYVQKKMQQEQMEKQKKEQEEFERRQQAEMDAANNEVSAPAGKVTGEAAAGASNKQRTTQKLQSDRKKLSSAG
jgi:hypothetical protein